MVNHQLQPGSMCVCGGGHAGVWTRQGSEGFRVHQQRSLRSASWPTCACVCFLVCCVMQRVPLSRTMELPLTCQRPGHSL
jgi:hypothetical protein